MQLSSHHGGKSSAAAAFRILHAAFGDLERTTAVAAFPTNQREQYVLLLRAQAALIQTGEFRDCLPRFRGTRRRLRECQSRQHRGHECQYPESIHHYLAILVETRASLTLDDTGRYSRRVYHWIVLALACCSVCAQTPANPFAGDPDAAKEGNSVFRPFCTPCHGIRGQGGRGPDLTLGIYTSGEKDSDLFRAISNGIPGTEMAGFGGDITEENIWRIVAYLRAIARHDATGVPGDRANGERLFWAKGGCGACHVVSRRGGRLGPELTRIGERRSLEYLRNAILTPSKEIVPGWGTIVIVKNDGTKVTGVERGFDNFSAQLIDAAGNYYSFSRNEVASIQRDPRSLMPEDYGRSLTSSEIDDLLAYLVSLRGGEASR